jgi:hypothetical protein
MKLNLLRTGVTVHFTVTFIQFEASALNEWHYCCSGLVTRMHGRTIVENARKL